MMRPTMHRSRGRGRRHRPWDNRNRGPSTDNIEEFGSTDSPCVTIAVEGCCHGELDAIYGRLQQHQALTGRKVDLLLCCGDFQSLRNTADFHSLAVPHKYRSLGSFYRYYAGESVAPVLTIFIGGNHEASQPLHELNYGGWVAPNIYYLGAAGVVNFMGVRIAGLSGIYKSGDYTKGHFERPPFDQSTMRSVYHVRHDNVHRLKCLQSKPDVFLSHDWPQGIEQHGDTAALLRAKPFFRQEVERNDLGSRPNRELLDCLQPKWWFSAHLHVKFQATVEHQEVASSSPPLVPTQAISSTTRFLGVESSDPCSGEDLTTQMTRFLALDKCLPRRQYLSIVHVPVEGRADNTRLEYDAEWLAILKATHELTLTRPGHISLPDPHPVSEAEIAWVKERLGGDLVIPENFEATVPAHQGPPLPLPRPLPPPLAVMGNPQTDRLLELLQLRHITTIPYQPVDDNGIDLEDVEVEQDSNEIDLGEDDGDSNEIDLDEDQGESTPSKKARVNGEL